MNYNQKKKPVKGNFRLKSSKGIRKSSKGIRKSPRNFKLNNKRNSRNKRSGSAAVLRKGSSRTYSSRGSVASRGSRPSSAHSRGSRYSQQQIYYNPGEEDYYGEEEGYYQDNEDYDYYQPEMIPPPRKKKRVNWGEEEHADVREFPNKYTVKIADKNLRIKNVDGRTKQNDVYSSINRMDYLQDAYFYPNPKHLIHPCKILFLFFFQ